MRILYGVVGEGMGHATRSRVILEHLRQHHDLQIVVSGRAYDYLERRFSNVVKIDGFELAYQDNTVDRSQTFWRLLKRLPEMASRNVERFTELSEGKSPDLVISDFESLSYAYARHHEIPVLSIDNMQIMHRCQHELCLSEAEQRDFQFARGIVKAKLPRCYHYLITTFFFPPLRKPNTSLFPPILRDEILDAQVTQGEHLLVYQTTTTNDRLLEVLQQTGLPCRVYGMGRSETIGKLELRSFSDAGFVADLASCRAVLASGGFSLMGEAVYLGKPILAVPLGKQFEQSLNAIYLEKLGYGVNCSELSASVVERFVANLEEYRRAVGLHRQDRNRAILAKLDQLIAEIAQQKDQHAD
ncbi:MAG: teichoic acid biosynthesis protein [Deltaproteobacteria bacterium]|nr:teichoic acid biosynthesis protein [Deltaproteobacteria bacterium]